MNCLELKDFLCCSIVGVVHYSDASDKPFLVRCFSYSKAHIMWPCHWHTSTLRNSTAQADFLSCTWPELESAMNCLHEPGPTASNWCLLDLQPKQSIVHFWVDVKILAAHR